MKKYILLVRVSTDRQDFTEQENQLYELAKRDGYDDNSIIIIAEKESAIKLSEEERNGLNKMKQAIDDNSDINCVYAWEVSRIARRKKVLFSVLEYLTDRKIQLIIKEPYLQLLKTDGTINEASETIFTLYAQMSESEMRNKAVRFKRTKDTNRAHGRYTGGFVQFGYKVNEATKQFEVNEDEAAVVREIFDMYASGHHSTLSIAKEMKARGIFQGFVSAIKCRISKMLVTKSYTGAPTSENKRQPSATDGNVYPPIISEELYNKVQDLLKANVKNPKKVNRSSELYIAKGLLRCSCGQLMEVRRDNRLYRCPHYECKGKGYFNANVVDTAIIWEAQRYYGQILKRKTSDFKADVEAEKQVLTQKINQNKKEAIEIEAKIDKLQDDYYTASSTLSESRFKSLMAKLLMQKDENKKQANSYMAEAERIEKKSKLINTDYYDSIISSLYNFKENSIEIKNIIDEIIKGVTVVKDDGNKYKIEIEINDNFNDGRKFTLYYVRNKKHLYERGSKGFEIPIFEIHTKKELSEEELEKRRLYYRNSNYKRRNKTA